MREFLLGIISGMGIMSLLVYTFEAYNEQDIEIATSQLLNWCNLNLVIYSGVLPYWVNALLILLVLFVINPQVERSIKRWHGRNKP